MQALAMRIHINEASPLISHSITGVNNRMADVASRTFHRNTTTHKMFTLPNDDFLHLFNSTFPLQDNSWRSFHLSSKITLLVFSERAKHQCWRHGCESQRKGALLAALVRLHHTLPSRGSQAHKHPHHPMNRTHHCLC